MLFKAGITCARALSCAVCALWFAVLIGGAGVAVGAKGHSFSLAFPSTVSPEVKLSLVWTSNAHQPVSGVAVSKKTGDVFVADTGNNRVDVFSPSGAFLRAWGWGVVTEAAEPQICFSSCRVGLSGSQPGEFADPVFITVDNRPGHGEVYVGDDGDNLVSKFDEEGHLIASWGNNGENASHERIPNGQLNGETSPEDLFSHGGKGPQLAGIALDGSGNLWVLAESTKLYEFAPSGGFLTKCRVKATLALRGIAAGTSDLYLLETFGKTERAPLGCALPEEPTVELLNGALPPSGLAFDESEGDLYVDGDGGLIRDLPATCVATGSRCQARAAFGESGEGGVLHEGAGVAVDPTSGTVYVANVGSQQVFAYAVAVEAQQEAPSEVGTHEALLHGSVNPEGTELSRCEFEYGPGEAYESVAPCTESVESIGHGKGPVPVQAKVTGLTGGTEYHFRLRAANALGDVRSEGEPLKTVKTVRVLSVAAEVIGSTAVLDGRVNPEGLGGAYRFELGACPTLLECPNSPYRPLEKEGTIAASNAEVLLPGESVEGLTPGIYHFRVNIDEAYPDQAGTEEGTFVIAPAVSACGHTRPQAGSEALPDCRAYEMVTPSFKNGSLVESGAFLDAPGIAANGSRVIASTVQCFDEPPSCTGARGTDGVPFAFERGEAGWSARPLGVPATFSGATWVEYRADTGLALYVAPPGEGLPEQFYLREAAGALKPLGPIQEEPGAAFLNETVSAPLVTTSDLSHVAYDGDGLFKFDAAERHGGVYMYPGLSGHPVLADVFGLERGSEELIGICGALLGGRWQSGQKYRTLSADGRSVVFTVFACPAGGTGGHKNVTVPADSLYERTEASDGTMRTPLVSGRGPGGACSSKACTESTPEEAEYAGASADGSQVFFTSTQQLTNNATEDRRGGDGARSPGCIATAPDTGGCNLYRWECPSHCEDEATMRLVDVSAGDTSGLGPQVQGVTAASEDGSSVYFVARGVLAGPNSEGARPAAGADNLYVWGPDPHHEGASRTAFVGTLSSTDAQQWGTGPFYANVSPDGRFMVFTSSRPLTKDVARAQGPGQVYRYDAQSEQLLRVSIGQEGFGDNGNGGSGAARIVPAASGFEMGGRADPSMSDDGRFVFFESPIALAPGAVKDELVKTAVGSTKVLAENVYEWEASGAKASADAPACAQPGGCVWLISDGRDLLEGSKGHENESAVHLLGSDATGMNVFFETADQLVAGDTDSQVDIYDARVDGGFPAAVEQPECEGLESCHPGSEALAPVFAGAGSGAQSAFGNFPTGSEGHPPESPKCGGGGGEHCKPLSAAQLLARALAACRHKTGRKRASCERTARAAYRARLLAQTLAVCRHKGGHSRVVCEHNARARYARRGR